MDLLKLPWRLPCLHPSMGQQGPDPDVLHPPGPTLIAVTALGALFDARGDDDCGTYGRTQFHHPAPVVQVAPHHGRTGVPSAETFHCSLGSPVVIWFGVIPVSRSDYHVCLIYAPKLKICMGDVIMCRNNFVDKKDRIGAFRPKII